MNISNFGIGASNIASLGRALSVDEASKLFELANELNVNVIDTADTYGSGDSERLIAKAINGKLKNNFFIITKAGFPYSNLPGYLSPLNQIAKKVIQKIAKPQNFSGKYLESSLHKSLKRLKRDAVGAFVLHEPGEGSNVTDDCWLTLEKIKQKGMAEYTGISSGDFEIINKGILSGKVDIVETPVSFCAENHNKILSICKNKNIPVIANQIFLPLKDLNDNKTTLIKTVAAEYGFPNLPVRNILISYAKSLDGVSSSLFGTTNLSHLKDNVKAGDAQLPKEMFFKISKIFNPIIS